MIRCADVDLHVRGLDEPGAAGLLSADEIGRASRFHLARDRARFIAARSALRAILSRYLDTDPRSIEFRYNAYGKPEVDGVFFNVSHSAGVAIYAVSGTREVGVDLERIHPDFAAGQIPEHFFAPAETRAIRDSPQHLQLTMFFRCWTRKEAYIKARGMGVSIPLASFDALTRPIEGWEIESFTPFPGYAAAVAVKYETKSG